MPTAVELSGVVAEHIAAVNAFDLERIVATFAPDAYVNDDRREIWGTDAIRAFITKEFVGDHVTIGEPVHNNVTGDSAYVVVPAAMTFDLNGTHLTQTGATFTGDFATTSNPLVALSRRWTIPGRATPPIPDSEPPQWAMSALTSVPE